MGAIVAIADGVSTGGMGREAAQTTVTSLVRDYFGTPETWDTTVALDLCTLADLVLRGQSYALAHVGDTRAYLLRGGNLTQLSTDHVVDHPDFSHQLLRSVGLDDRLVVDYSQGDVQVGDVFVLGVTLYQLLTHGRLPYGDVLPYQSGRYLRDPVAPSRHNPEVPIWLDHVALKTVARDKRLRFETAEELLLALERVPRVH